MDEEVTNTLAKELGITLKAKDPGINRQLLTDKITELIQTDFNKLITILYRLDVSEEKIKKLLKESPGIDAGNIIADLIIERQEQKIKSRQQFSQRDKNIDEEDKW